MAALPPDCWKARAWGSVIDGNSPKHPETVEPYVSAIRVLRAWLEREGGNQRIPLVLDLLAQRSAAGVAAGHAAPAMDADTLRRLYTDANGGLITEMPAARWLARPTVMKWWEQREDEMQRACREAGLEACLELHVQEGGGRGNATLYRLDLCPMPGAEESVAGADREAVKGTNSGSSQRIQYLVEPAQAVWWFRLLIGTAPFRMRSGRGYALIGAVGLVGVAGALFAALIFLSMNNPRPVSAADVLAILMLSLLTFTYWKGLQSIIRLPLQRITVASDSFLSWNQLYGQFRLTRDARSKVAGGWFQLVRHWGYCPICSGEVEVQPGGVAFPGRVVGRCTDSPLEHVFSFDPVSLSGSPLRP